MPDHPLWLFLAVACLVWYSTITVFVAIRGAADIRTMLERLDAIRIAEESGSAAGADPEEPTKWSPSK